MLHFVWSICYELYFYVILGCLSIYEKAIAHVRNGVSENAFNTPLGRRVGLFGKDTYDTKCQWGKKVRNAV